MNTFISHSQIGQDRFVFELLVRPENLFTGTFLDIGCHTPIEINNTYALEQLGWRGVLVDLVKHPGIEDRASRFIEHDAVTLHWPAVLERTGLAGRVVDYVSLDVDEAQLAALENLLNSGVRFRVATIEHDGYRFGPERVLALRALMVQHGYTLLAQDISLSAMDPLPFEDWWVSAATVDMNVARRFQSIGKCWSELFILEPARGDARPTMEVTSC